MPVGAGWLSVQNTGVGRGSMGTCRLVECCEPVGMLWQIQSDFEAFICCRLLFWRLRALAADRTGARQ